MLSQTGLTDSQEHHDFGGIAWVLLACLIVAYDLGALHSQHHSTLSAAFYRASRKSRWKLLVTCFWLYLTAHLFRWVPYKFDILRRLFG